MSNKVSIDDINKIRQVIEDAVGSLMLVQQGNFNEAEKIRIYITCTRVIGRTILWGTTITNFQMPYFIWRSSIGFNFDVQTAIEYLTFYGCAILEELEFYEKHFKNQNLILDEDPEEEEVTSDGFDF